jgi:hypothetical protein
MADKIPKKAKYDYDSFPEVMQRLAEQVDSGFQACGVTAHTEKECAEWALKMLVQSGHLDGLLR